MYLDVGRMLCYQRFRYSANSICRYELKQMLMKSSISRVPEELRKHEAAQQKSQKGGGQKKIEDSSGFAGKGGWQ